MIRKKPFLFTLLGVVTLAIIYLVVWLILTDIQVRAKFANKSFLKPTQFYSNTLEVLPNQILAEKALLDVFQKNGYRQKDWGSVLQESDFSVGFGEPCAKIYSASFKCYAFHQQSIPKIHVVAVDETDRVLVILETDTGTQESKALERLALFPQLFAQYLGASPVLQQTLPLSQIPRQCLDAALAVEDPHFLEHQGVSIRGLLRAVYVNLRSFRLAQGGSTITQQLVKNHFLSSERTFSRKIKEMVMAVLVEWHIPKDEILETYLNIIYLGQQGNFQVRGYAAAAQFYFNKDIRDLNLPECALLGAVVNSPGLYNPFRHVERATLRREKVLKDMVEQNRILQEDFAAAVKHPLPTKSQIEIKETSPYFIEGVVATLKREGFHDLSGYKIYTTLDLNAQSYAQKAVQNHLNQLEASSKYHQKNKTHSLQGVLVAAHHGTGEVLAVVGGRDHRTTPFNRVFSSSRQVGSIFKPLVYLTAFADKDEFGPMTPIDNSPYTYTYEKQSWSPRNYDSKFGPPVPAFYALKESLNVPTARLAIEVGLDEIIEIAEELGVTSALKSVPALSLGAFEMTPFEVLQLYTNIARLGSTKPLRLIKHVDNQDGEAIFTPAETEAHQVLEPGDFVNLNSVLREVMISGTGQSVLGRGLTLETAGKTGTTSNYKDAWFAGFSSNHVAIVWTGYDDNTPIQLSGASGALPIWTDYMLSMSGVLDRQPFQWPMEQVETLSITPEELLQAGVPENKAVPTQLLFYKKQ